MRLLCLLLAVIPLFLNGCGESGPADPDVPVDQLVSSAIIGPDGGTLEGGGLVLTVPQGALDSDHDLNLYLSSESGPQDADVLTRIYAVEGFPALFHLPLRLSIEAGSAPTDSALLALGADAVDPSTGSAEIVYQYYPTRDSSGCFVCMLPPFDGKDSGDFPSLSRDDKARPGKIMMLSIDGKTAYVSSENFDGIVPRTGPILLFGQVLAALESAYGEFNKLLGYTGQELESRARYMTFPFDVHLAGGGSGDDARPDRFCYYTRQVGYLFPSLNAAEDFDIQVIKSRLTDANMPQIKRDLAHYLYFFYPLAFYTEDCEKTEQFWLHHAIAAWSECRFPATGGFTPLNFGTHFWAPFRGMHLSGEDTPHHIASHGIGMSPLIEYLVSAEGDGVIKRIFDSLADHKIALEAVLEGTESSEAVWWPGFFKQYIGGDIYGVDAGRFLGGVSGTFTIGSAGDTLKHFDADYPDLSARLFRIDLNHEAMRERGILEFKTGPTSLNLDYVRVLVFGLMDGQLEFLDEGVDFTVGGLEAYGSLVVAVVNSASEAPYTEDLRIELDVRARVSDWPWRFVSIVVRDITARVESYTPAYDRYDTTAAWSLTLSHQPYEMEKQGNTFVGHKDKIYDWGTHTTREKGIVTITVNEITKDIVTFAVVDTMISEEGEDTHIEQAAGHGIPYYWHDDQTLEHMLSSEVGAHLAEFMWTSVQNEGTWHEIRYRVLEVVSYDDASIEFYWSDSE